jgi:hypothetical protein
VTGATDVAWMMREACCMVSTLFWLHLHDSNCIPAIQEQREEEEDDEEEKKDG